ncbi:MDIS1-interacting receptor like kinase 2-like [Dioscorea cayenensis subsp. rotundata]|uniref:MDIS1-interacting receptor like kinase 2-like n=1 Tax=Dioscorea cayennensis subsp. rotundata TaxID=55577 RepID=A0AB40AYR8_DIOCR|nr:MDIS1-interacting receptor like kinase 2-like [Dioscorea cayenensis subsp. rotundata]
MAPALEVIHGTHPGDLLSNLSLSMLVKDMLDPRIPLCLADQVTTNQVLSMILIAMQCINIDPQLALQYNEHLPLITS